MRSEAPGGTVSTKEANCHIALVLLELAGYVLLPTFLVLSAELLNRQDAYDDAVYVLAVTWIYFLSNLMPFFQRIMWMEQALVLIFMPVMLGAYSLNLSSPGFSVGNEIAILGMGVFLVSIALLNAKKRFFEHIVQRNLSSLSPSGYNRAASLGEIAGASLVVALLVLLPGAGISVLLVRKIGLSNVAPLDSALLAIGVAFAAILVCLWSVRYSSAKESEKARTKRILSALMLLLLSSLAFPLMALVISPGTGKVIVSLYFCVFATSLYLFALIQVIRKDRVWIRAWRLYYSRQSSHEGLE